MSTFLKIRNYIYKRAFSKEKPEYKSFPDDFLVKNWIETKSEDVFLELHDRHSEEIFMFAYQMLGNNWKAEEIVQEVFLDFVQKPQKYVDLINFRKYALAVAFNLVKKTYQTKGVEISFDSLRYENDFDVLDEDMSNSLELSIYKQYEEKAWLAVEKLSLDHKAAFILAAYGYTAKEVAKQLDLKDERKAENLIHRARKKVRKDLGYILGEK